MAQLQIRALKKNPNQQKKLSQEQESQPNESPSQITEVPEKQANSEQEKPNQQLAQKAKEFNQEENPRFFQAIGVIEGKVSFNDHQEAKITLADQVYPLLYVPRQRYKLLALQKHIQETGNATQRLVVYPKIIHFPDPKTPQQIQFHLVRFEAKTSPIAPEKLNNMEFQIAGLWQFIPVCRVPCISVFKNLTPERLEWIKQADAKQRVRFMKAAHLPVFWKEAPVKPFRYNPKAEQQEKPAFVKIKAIFLPNKNAFGFKSLLESPTTKEVPKFLKVSKKDKQLAQQKPNEETNSHHFVVDQDASQQAKKETKGESEASLEERITLIANQLENLQEIANQNQSKQAEIITNQLISHGFKDASYFLTKSYLSNWKHGKNLPKETSKHYPAYRLWQFINQNN
ncbi:UNVERIFIED_CONTAM: hypothetical protein BEN50_09785 [Euhalothece sp. KZN 001]